MLKTVTFTYRTDRNPAAYYCSEPNDQSGEYVGAEVARGLLTACEALLATGMNGGNNVRLALIAAKQDALSDEELAEAERSEQAVKAAQTAIAQAKGK